MYAEKDIKVRNIARAENVFGKLKPILIGGFRQEMRNELVKTLIRCVVT